MEPSQQYKFLRHALRDGRSFNSNASFWYKFHLDPWLFMLLVINSIFGLIIIYSATSEDTSMLVRQASSFIVGFIVMIVFAQIPPKVYQVISPYLYAVSIVLLLMVLFIGEVRLGAKRWLSIPGVGSVQPSEFMKFTMPLMVAWYFSRKAIPPKLIHIIFAICFARPI